MLTTPAAEPLVGSWRADHDWPAAHGIPAHVTVRLPFLPRAVWMRGGARESLVRWLPVELTLTRVEDRPGGLVVLVEPDDELRRITAAVGAVWPELPPHKDDRPDLAYHVTVVRTPDRAIRAAAAAAIAPHLPLPVLGTAFMASEGSAEAGLDHAVLASASR